MSPEGGNVPVFAGRAVVAWARARPQSVWPIRTGALRASSTNEEAIPRTTRAEMVSTDTLRKEFDRGRVEEDSRSDFIFSLMGSEWRT